MRPNARCYLLKLMNIVPTARATDTDRSLSLMSLTSLSLTASRVRCRILDNVAAVMVRKTYTNKTGKPVSESAYTFPAFPAGKLVSFAMNVAHRSDILKTVRGQLPANTPPPSFNQGQVNQFTVALPYEVSPNEDVIVQLEYFVRLTNDIEMQWTLTLPEDIIPMETERAQPVPDWDMPKVRNPESLYHREKTGSDVVGAAFSALPKAKPKVEDMANECDEVDWAEVSGERPLSPNCDDGVTADSEKANAVEVETTFEVFIEAYVSKGIAKLTVSGKPLYKKVEGRTAEVLINLKGLDRYGPFRCTTHETNRTLPVPIVWSAKTPGKVDVVKVSWDPTVCQGRKMDNDGNIDLVCLVDCSDAMEGSNMINVRRALKLMLNALPHNCHFNIYGLGRKWSRLLNQLYPYREGFSKTRGPIQKMRANLGPIEGDILPVMAKAVKSANLKSSRSRILLITTVANQVDGYPYQAIWEEAGIPIYSVLLKQTRDNLPTDIEMISHESHGCCEYVTEPDLLDQALLRQVRRCFYGEEAAVKIQNSAKPLSASAVADRTNPEAFFVTDPDVDSIISQAESEPLTVSRSDIICNAEVQGAIRPASGSTAHVLQLAADDACLDCLQNDYATIISNGNTFVDHLPWFVTGRKSKAVPGATGVASRWQRPWQMALGDEYAQDVDANVETDQRQAGEDVFVEDSNSASACSSSSSYSSSSSSSSCSDSDDDWESQLPKRPIPLSQSFDLISYRLAQAVEGDGQVSWKLAAKMLQLPKRPYKWANQDLWATVLTMTYLQLKNRTDDPCWDMYLDKAWKWVQEQCPDDGHRRWLFQRAKVNLEKACSR